MPVHRFADMTWEEVRDADRGRSVAIVPVGAVEAHGPHLPLGTDVVIAEAMARSCAERLDSSGLTVFVLPPIWYTSASFARAFPGTIDVDGATVTALVRRIALALAGQGIGTLAIANAHLDPGHLRSLRDATSGGAAGARVVFVDLTRRAVAECLTEEFRTGACHAGRFEGSVVLAEEPALFREGIAVGLEPNPASLSMAVREGKTSFEDAGGPRAYFGRPAEATAEEGHETVRVLGALLADAVFASLGADA